MSMMEEQKLIDACDALIEQKQFKEAFELLEKSSGIVATWLKGKVHLSVAKSISDDYMFQNYATQEMKIKYRDILLKAYDHLYNTVMSLTEGSMEFRSYLNEYLWRQLGQTENELARTSVWVEPDEDEQEEEDSDWSPNPDNLTDYITEMKI